MRCLIMNGSNGRSPRMWVRSWMRSHMTKVSSVSSWSSSRPAASVGQLAGEVISAAARSDAAEAGGLAVGEDGAPGEGRGLADGHGLREEHGGVGVVAGGEVEEADRHEELVGVVARLQAGDELGPDDLDQHGLDEAVAAAVLGVHREDHQVLQSVDPVLLRLERQQGVQEVRNAEAAVGPAVEVGDQQFQVVARRAGRPGPGPRPRAMMVATWPARPAWSAASGTEPSWTWRACRAVAAALSRSHSGCAGGDRGRGGEGGRGHRQSPFWLLWTSTGERSKQSEALISKMGLSIRKSVASAAGAQRLSYSRTRRLAQASRVRRRLRPVVGDELQGDGVDAVALVRGRAVALALEHVAQVRIAGGAAHLDPVHAQGPVVDVAHGARRPAVPRRTASRSANRTFPCW